MLEMILDDNVEYQNEFHKYQNQNYTPETRRKIIKNCLELKRLLDKESAPLLSDSPIQKALFSKTASVNVTTLFRCLKEFLDVDSTVVITTLLQRMSTNAECATSNLSMMAKRNLSPILLSTLYAIYSEYLFPSECNKLISANMSTRIDDANNSILLLLTKMSKYGKLN
jgi:hypothetical protein